MKVSAIKIGLLLMVFFCLSLPCSRIPRDVLTASSMHGLKQSILNYCKEHNQHPVSLELVQTIEGKTHRIKDYWGRKFDYEISEGVVLLRSLGSDKKVGGEGMKADIVRKFPLKNRNGQWSDDACRWVE